MSRDDRENSVSILISALLTWAVIIGGFYGICHLLWGAPG